MKEYETFTFELDPGEYEMRIFTDQYEDITPFVVLQHPCMIAVTLPPHKSVDIKRISDEHSLDRT